MKVLIRVVLIVTLGLIVRTAVSALGETTTPDNAAADPGSCQVSHEGNPLATREPVRSAV